MYGPTTDLILQRLREGGSIVSYRGAMYLRLSNGLRGATIHPDSIELLIEEGLLSANRPIHGRIIYRLKADEGTNQ